jgi:predicted outer membrane protein
VRAAGRYLQSFEAAFSPDGVRSIMRLFSGSDPVSVAAALTPHTIHDACQRACATISRLEAAVAALKADADASVAGFDKAVAEHHAVTTHRLRQQLQELQSQVHLTTTEVMQKQQRMHDEALEAQVIPRIYYAFFP